MCKIRDRRLSGVTQLSKALFSGIIAAMLSTIVMAGGDQLSEDPSFKLIKKESGGKITAIATYDNGRSAFCGDSDGNIYCVSNSGYWKVVNAKASIDSIIIGNALTGNFCFTASGKAFAYTLKGNKIIDISGNLPEKIERLYRDGGSKKIYAVTENDEIYSLSDDGSLKWESVATETAKKILDNISARMDSDKSASSDNVSSYGKNFKGMQNGQIYVSSSYDRKDMTVKVDYVSDAIKYTDSAIYRVTIEGCRLNAEDIFIKGYNGFKYTLSSDVNNIKYNKDAYPVVGVIYESDGKDGATLQNRPISFLWLGPKCTNDGDHKLFVNEVAYNFSANPNKDQIISSVPSLPIDLPASELPLDYSEYSVAIDTENPTPTTESNGTCAMPFNAVIRNERREILPADDESYDTPGKNPYNHLVFYAIDRNLASVKTDGLIGCDFSSKSDRTAILPADKVEVDGLGGGDNYIKYGVLGANLKGKTFYAYVKSNGPHALYAALLVDSTLHEGLSPTLYIKGETLNVDINPESGGLNNPNGRNFTFSPKGLYGSNWQGNEFGYGGYLDYQLTGYNNNSYEGVFVYLPEGLNTRSPEDGDETKLGAKDGTKKNLCSNKLAVGYYFNPQVDPNNPLLAVNYSIIDTPSYCSEMRNKHLSAMLFDQHGRSATYNVTDRDEAMDPIGGKNLWDIREEGKWDKGSNMLWEVGNLYNTPVIMGCPNSDPEYNKKVKYGITDRGLFVPPISPSEIKNDKYTGVNASFMSDISVWIHGKDNLYNNNIGKFKIAGYNFATSPDNKSKPAELFFNTLEIKDLNGSSSISLNVTNYLLQDLAKWPELIMSNAGITSVNRINIKHPGWMASDWLDAWSAIHLPTDLASNYAYHYNLYYNKKEVKTRIWEYPFTNDGNYVVEQGEGSVLNYPMQGKWISDEYHKYGCNTCLPYNTTPSWPGPSWPIIKN